MKISEEHAIVAYHCRLCDMVILKNRGTIGSGHKDGIGQSCRPEPDEVGPEVLVVEVPE